ncbi:hypothetical protein BGC30_01905 [Novacetimonas hansenii]|nr:hypothetical protein BGC30_01905 [Novacetimonas hansenii]
MQAGGEHALLGIAVLKGGGRAGGRFTKGFYLWHAVRKCPVGKEWKKLLGCVLFKKMLSFEIRGDKASSGNFMNPAGCRFCPFKTSPMKLSLETVG